MEKKEKEQIDYTGMIIIHGDLFQFGESRNKLSLYGDPSHQINFQNLDRGYGAYSGAYSQSRRNFVSVFEFLRGTEPTRDTHIPLKIMEEGGLLTTEQIREYNETSLSSKQGYYFVDRDLSERLNGRLPPITIYGKDYNFDINKVQLICVDDPKKIIQFNRCDVFEPSVILYDISTDSQVKMKAHQQHLYPNACGIRFPALQEWDIIERAKMSDLPPTALICEMPWRPDLTKMETMPLSEVNITKINQHNKKQQALEMCKLGKKRKRRGPGTG
jgi:hypothetical protein